MKKLLTLIALITLSYSVSAQKTDTALFKGAYKIIIENDLPAQENFKAVGQGLVDLDYQIEKKDAEFGQIITAPFKIKDGSGVSVILANIKDKKIILYAQHNSGTSDRLIGFIDYNSSFKPITYRAFLSTKYHVFLKVESFAKSLPHNSLTYSE